MVVKKCCQAYIRRNDQYCHLFLFSFSWNNRLKILMEYHFRISIHHDYGASSSVDKLCVFLDENNGYCPC